MTERAVDIGIATGYLPAGSIILTNLDALTRFDQSSGLKMHSWFKNRLGALVPMESRSLFRWDAQCSQEIKSRICRCGYPLSLGWLHRVVSIPYALHPLISRKWSHSIAPNSTRFRTPDLRKFSLWTKSAGADDKYTKADA